jgi:hypothetical protein
LCHFVLHPQRWIAKHEERQKRRYKCWNEYVPKLTHDRPHTLDTRSKILPAGKLTEFKLGRSSGAVTTSYQRTTELSTSIAPTINMNSISNP